MYRKNIAHFKGFALDTLRIMKLIIILLTISLMQVSAAGLGQTVSLKVNKITFSELVVKLKQQTNYDFIYSSEALENVNQISITCQGKPLPEVLDECFKAHSISYTINGNTVLISKTRDRETSQNTQQVDVSGTVTDQKGEALVGVTVKVKGTNQGTSTDINGQFRINVASENPVLVFDYIGFKTKEVQISGQNSITVVLEATSQNLNEVVVVGYGVQRKSDLTGSVTSIKGADLTKIGGSNPAEALQGKAPGVQISSQGGPGAAPLVFIRGLGTNGDASPLYVVDGMMVANIAFLAPSDIASMEILKDASATSIYGSRGANGVILVTTKKGKNGKPVFNFSTSQGSQFLTRRPDIANGQEYAQLVNLFKTNAGLAPVYTDLASMGEGTDWSKELLQNGMSSDYQLAVSGGSEKTNYNISATYHQEDGIVKFSDFNRLTLRANSDYQLNNRLKIGHNLSFAKSNFNGSAQWNGGRGLNSLYRISPLLSVYKDDGSYTPGQDPDIINPYAASELNKDVHTSPLQFVGNAYLNYELVKGLSFRSSYGTDYALNRINSYVPAFNVSSPNQIQGSNSLQSGYETRYTWLWENTLTYDKQLRGDHHINLLAGYTAQNYNFNALDITGSGLLATGEDNRYLQALPTSSLSWSNTTFPSSESILSYLFRANYNYKDRYLLTASIRADGSSKFAEGKKWGNFPSFALGWNASNENFLKDINWISSLKLRGSWGQVGSNKIANYQTYSTLYQEMTYSAVFNRVFYNNATIIAASNPDITWEFSEQTDLGIEFATLNNRLKFEVDYYNRDTKNLLLQLPIPGGSSGISIPAYSNVGVVRNKGYEFIVGWDDKTHGLNYGIKFTGSANKNEILDFKGLTVFGSDFMVPSTHISRAGSSIGNFYGYSVDRIAQSQSEIDQLNANAVAKSGVAGKQFWSGLKPGDLIFKDLNGDGVIDVKDKTDIGSPHAKFVGGVSVTAAFKGFDFAVDMMGSFGGKINNSSRNQFVTSGLSNLNVEWLNSWTPTNTNTTIPRYAVNTSTTQQSDFTLSDATYIKARYIELGYTFNKGLLSRVKVSNLRLYVNTTNPFYITKYKGFSPEVSNSYSVSTMGDDFRTYPVSGTVRAGVNVTF